MASDNIFKNEFIQNACYRLDESLRMIKICLDKLDEAVIWQKPNESANSIGNLILHLCGNITQYGIASLEGLEDNRNRDKEFETLSGYSKQELFQKLSETVEKAKQNFSHAPEHELLRKRSVQGFEFSGIGNIVHVVEHFSYHTGQIALWTKLLNNGDLGFYDGMNLNAKNKN
ncbi:DinB family protein [Flagellimonas sp. S3867]|uniref:DinB family protein n=1 Tax=Flagellimonas sp. S3867 TaxID=2768063 RepID=UPI001689D39D|nr:DinB family protein [Flagellimonas sp. S3867]